MGTTVGLSVCKTQNLWYKLGFDATLCSYLLLSIYVPKATSTEFLFPLKYHCNVAKAICVLMSQF